MVSSAVGLVLELLLVTEASCLAGDATLATGVVVVLSRLHGSRRLADPVHRSRPSAPSNSP